MTAVKGTGKILNIKCTEIAIPEFPELLFGTHFDGSKIFDATHYLHIKDPDGKLSVEDFFKQFSFQVNAIAKSYDIPADKLAYINTEGHQLIDGSLCYPFLSYVDTQFCAYINEMMDELFINGVVVSDSHLIALVKKRLSPELFKQLWKNDKN